MTREAGSEPGDAGTFADAAAPHLAFLQAASPRAAAFEVFALLRHAEAYAAGLPRIGRARLPARDVATLTHAPRLAFPGSTLESVTVRGGRGEVRGHYLGLTGPMGPLPLHLTEFANYEERYGRTRSFGRFLDLVAGRMLQFFYRAWADAQPAAQADRPADDRFGTYVAALTGAAEGAGAAFDARTRLHYAALFAGRRSAGAIEDGLRHLLGTEVTIHPFEPSWRPIAVADQTRLGRADGFARLGQGTVAGSRVRLVEDTFRVTVQARNLRDYEALLPGGPRHALAVEALDAFAPGHLEWRLELAILDNEIPAARLNGRAAMGWTAWLGKPPAPTGRFRADARLKKQGRHGASRQQGGSTS